MDRELGAYYAALGNLIEFPNSYSYSYSLACLFY